MSNKVGLKLLLARLAVTALLHLTPNCYGFGQQTLREVEAILGSVTAPDQKTLDEAHTKLRSYIKTPLFAVNFFGQYPRQPGSREQMQRLIQKFFELGEVEALDGNSRTARRAFAAGIDLLKASLSHCSVAAKKTDDPEHWSKDVLLFQSVLLRDVLGRCRRIRAKDVTFPWDVEYQALNDQYAWLLDIIRKIDQPSTRWSEDKYRQLGIQSIRGTVASLLPDTRS